MTNEPGFSRPIQQEGSNESDGRSSHRIASTLLTLGLWMLLNQPDPVSADEILVVSGADTPINALNRTETANLFLGLEHTTIPLVPFDQRDRELRRDFYREVAGRSLASVRAHWAKRVFTGRGRPPAMLESGEADRVISANPAAVTYLPEVQLPAGGKVLLYLPRGTQQ